jgi:epoxyqueuosine reductase
MITRENIIEEGRRLGFADVGFTTAEPFEAHRKFLADHQQEYGWAEAGLALMAGVDPKLVFPKAKSIIVLLENYLREAIPPPLDRHFGRCYLDDDRMTKDGLAIRVKAFRSFLRANGIDSKVSFNLPHRMAAARAGLGTLGKNCLFFAGRAARQSSWVVTLALVVDQKFEPDEPTIKIDCPEWCRNACIAACPTRALKGNGTIDPRKCISYLTYFGKEITPHKLREPMGMNVYGCDICQEICPRNKPWLSQDLAINQRVVAKAKHFDLVTLLHMDQDFFTMNVWPHMFYMPPDNLWKWKMNVARVLGNSRDERYLPELIRAFSENSDERTRGMIAWALGHIGGIRAREVLEGFLSVNEGLVHEEIVTALDGT